MWHHAPADKKFQDRQSRHYYDLVRLYGHALGMAAVKDTDLLLTSSAISSTSRLLRPERASVSAKRLRSASAVDAGGN
jgi:hypothetical protein